jgi:hypothetical protein
MEKIHQKKREELDLEFYYSLPLNDYNFKPIPKEYAAEY